MKANYFFGSILKYLSIGERLVISSTLTSCISVYLHSFFISYLILLAFIYINKIDKGK